MSQFLEHKTIGILGGGQLSRMLLQQAQLMGVECIVMSSHKLDPAAQISNSWVQGNITKWIDVKKFCNNIDILTFESEFIKPDILRKLKSIKSLNVHPGADLMMDLQDRLHQKNLLLSGKLNTSPFIQVDNVGDLKRIRKFPCVLKARFDGYDGKGTYVLKSLKDKRVVNFLKDNPKGCIAENFISFKRELAISLVRSSNGDIKFFPLVESYQKNLRCLWIKGPVVHPRLNLLKSRLKNFVIKNNYIGLISFEMFDTGNELLVNELAPRVHNSAHYTIEALCENQFSAHLKAILGQELRTPSLVKEGFSMLNLIGSKARPARGSIKEPGVFLHWYHKSENRVGRKMGHLTCLANTPTRALNKLKKAAKEIKL